MKPISLPLRIAGTVLSALCGLFAAAESPSWPDAYDVEWDSPSEECRGSMPLGNGQVAINAWIEPDGSILFYIARSDAWDEYGRLLKLGKVRVKLDPMPGAVVNFRQRLRLRDATMTASWGKGRETVSVGVWIDAAAPVIHVEAETGLPTTALAAIELWRTEPTEIRHLEVSDVLLDRDHPDGKRQAMIARPDVVLQDWPSGIGWYHHNTESIGPALTARIQGLDDFSRPDPLLDRVFGAAVTAENGRRLSDRELQTPQGTRHHFAIYVHSRYPATPENWLRSLVDVKNEYEAVPLESHRDRHRRLWLDFWSRSRVMITGTTPTPPPRCVPDNEHPIRFGIDQAGGNRFRGDLERVSIWNKALDDAAVKSLSQAPAGLPPDVPDAFFTGSPEPGGLLQDSADTDFSQGMTLETWVKPEHLPPGGGRLIDKTTPGQNNGFLLDTYPGNSLRCIVGDHILQLPEALPAGERHHVAVTVAPAPGEIKLFHDGVVVARKRFEVLDPAFVVSRGYCLQRFITACAGKGPYPIKFNGSLFTTAWPQGEADADYRRWGPGYWWQNTRLPYYAMCAGGDAELMQPLFQMYARDLVPLFEHRTKKYFGHEGMFIPECIYFWGDVFSETYGWTPFEERGEDKLQSSGWHKWEWVSGLELAWLLLDYYEHTQDEAFLRDTALPAIRSVLTFFDRHYPLGDDGKLVMHPAQALETWWDCTNPMPEIAGLHAVTRRLLTLPEGVTSTEDRRFWQSLQGKLPELPTREEDGVRFLAPAAQFANKRNIENPELYAVFPFRLVSFEKDNRELGVEALRRRLDRGHIGWRQDDVFMAYLGLAEEAREYVVARASEWNGESRFPAFWGPNYDWVPDQDHGSVLMIAVQSMLMQCEGRKIFVLPAWPRDWNVQFTLHAPYRTIVSGEYRDGRLQTLEVTPPERRRDVVLPPE
ncbi:MAG: hypothetical protein Kow0040_19980 [Thermogutta sp.]